MESEPWEREKRNGEVTEWRVFESICGKREKEEEKWV